MEKPAKGTKGFILYSPFCHNYFFRIYGDNHDFVDYEINCEELEVEIVCDWLSLYENKDRPTLDWSSKALGKNNDSRT